MNTEPGRTSHIDSKQYQTSQNFDEKTFDAHADLYEKMFAAPYRKYLELPTIEALLGDLTGLNVLDFGCGSGCISRWLQGKGAKSVVGYDVSGGMLSYAQRLEQQHPQGISYFATLDDVLKEQFDVVLAVYVMPYAPNKEKLLEMTEKMAWLLKPGGRLITLPIHPEFNADPEYYRPYGFRLIEKEKRNDGSLVELHICHPPYDVHIDAHYWSRDTISSTLRKAGFHSISWRQLQPPKEEQMHGVSLDDYLHAPHAGIVEGFKYDEVNPSVSQLSRG